MPWIYDVVSGVRRAGITIATCKHTFKTGCIRIRLKHSGKLRYKRFTCLSSLNFKQITLPMDYLNIAFFNMSTKCFPFNFSLFKVSGCMVTKSGNLSNSDPESSIPTTVGAFWYWLSPLCDYPVHRALPLHRHGLIMHNKSWLRTPKVKALTLSIYYICTEQIYTSVILPFDQGHNL